MSKLDAEQSRAVAGIIREFVRLMRDSSAARALLRVCQETRRCPVDFECDLEEIKKDPKYQAVGQSLELIAAHIEQSALEIDLNELLEKVPRATRPS
jgi:hypothetical protein